MSRTLRGRWSDRKQNSILTRMTRSFACSYRESLSQSPTFIVVGGGGISLVIKKS